MVHCFLDRGIWARILVCVHGYDVQLVGADCGSTSLTSPLINDLRLRRWTKVSIGCKGRNGQPRSMRVLQGQQDARQDVKGFRGRHDAAGSYETPSITSKTRHGRAAVKWSILFASDKLSQSASRYTNIEVLAVVVMRRMCHSLPNPKFSPYPFHC